MMSSSVRQTYVLSDGVPISLCVRYHPKPILPGLVVLLHGRLHNSKKGPCAELASRLSYSTLIYDARGMGESGGRSGWSNVEEEEDDLEQIMNYVRHNFEPPHNQILAIIGHSKGATVGLMFASRASFQSLSQPQLYDERLRPPLLIALSARYDTNDTGLSRFTPEQQAQLEKDGQFVWLRYRAGPGNEEAREYVVTKEGVEHAKDISLDCVKDLPSNCHVLLLHGRADGTVRYKETEKIDQQIRRSSPDASVDLIWVDGVKHNWDEDGDIEMVTEWINGWIKRRAGRDSSRVPEEKMIDHLGLQRDKSKQ